MENGEDFFEFGVGDIIDIIDVELIIVFIRKFFIKKERIEIFLVV